MSFKRVEGSHKYNWDYIDLSLIDPSKLNDPNYINAADIQEYNAYKEEYFSLLYDPNHDGYLIENFGHYGGNNPTPSNVTSRMRSWFDDATSEQQKDQISFDYHTLAEHFYRLNEQGVNFDPEVPVIRTGTPIPEDGILSWYYAEYGQGEETNLYRDTLTFIMGNQCLPQYTYKLPNARDSIDGGSILQYMSKVGLLTYAGEATYVLTIQYLDKADGFPLVEDYVAASMKYEEKYKVRSPVIEGYSLYDDHQTVVSGKMGAGNKTIKVYYKKDPEEIGGQDETTTTVTTYDSSLVFSAPTDLDRTKWDERLGEYNTGCYYIRYEGGQIQEVIPLPVFPQEFSDSNSAEFNSTTMLGRSVAYQTYNSSQRTVSFTLTLHEEIAVRGKKYYWTTDTNSTSEGSAFDSSTADGPEYDRVHALVARIQAACYPGYNEGVVSPPEVEFVIGNQFSIRGILTNCGASWKPPIINGRYVCCDLSIGITETTGPYSAAEITSIRGKRGINRNE